MFTDRLWVLKGAAALALLGWLCTQSRRVLSELHPEVEQVALFTDSLRGKTIHLWAKYVTASDAAGFQIDTYVGPMRVLTSQPPPVGSFVSAQARPIGPRTLEALSLHINEGFEWKRPLNYGISILTVVVYLWLVRRRFRWRIEEGVFRSRY
jgi:hypothetical protein